jgi:exopolyphosphatase/guanosine-5'-triphosphate,3'-diphosphate pyrophosphatase
MPTALPPAALTTSPDTKRDALLAWVRKHLGDVEHEQRVERLALTLFALTRPRHRLSQSERTLLSLAAIVHDVGRALEDDDHELHGAVMLQVAEDLPLTDTERRRLMFLTRYHRGKVPAEGGEEYLRPADDRASLRTLLALLRAADALDGRWMESPQVAMTVRGNTLSITCYLRNVTAKVLRKLGRKKKFLLLEDQLNLGVNVEILSVQGVELVA